MSNPGKLKSRWSSLYMLIAFTPYGAIGLRSDNGKDFQVNSQRVKLYLGQNLPPPETHNVGVVHHLVDSLIEIQLCRVNDTKHSTTWEVTQVPPSSLQPFSLFILSC